MTYSTYDPNTNRMMQYQFTVNGNSLTGALTWNANATLHALNITDALNSADNQSCSFLYDDLARLASTDCGEVWSQSYSYDQFGNITKNGSASFQPTYNSSTNRISSVSGFTPTYDNNGNTLTDPSHTYSWDSAGKPVAIDSVNMTYDALGRMVEQNRSGAFTQFVYGPHGGKFAIFNGQTLQKAFVPLPGGAQAVYNASGILYYGHSDHLGSVRLGSTSSRTVSFDVAYAPFGETYAASGSTDPAFTGQRQDTVSGLYDFSAREYNPQGRWPSPDPSGLASLNPTDPQTLNRYAYARNTPTSLVDPFGLESCDDSSDPEATCGDIWDSGGGAGGGAGDPTGMGDSGSGNGPSGGDQTGQDTGCGPDDPACLGTTGAAQGPPCDSMACGVGQAAMGYYGVTMFQYVESQPGQNGYFLGYSNIEMINEIYSFESVSGFFTVSNDVTSYDQSQIQALAPGEMSTLGFTDSSDPYVTYGASDLVSSSGAMGQVQAFELGNALALITGTPAGQIIDNPNNPEYNEPGYSFISTVMSLQGKQYMFQHSQP